MNKYLVEIESRAAAPGEGAAAATKSTVATPAEAKKTGGAASASSAGTTGLPKRNRKKFVAPIAKVDPDSIEKAH